MLSGRNSLHPSGALAPEPPVQIPARYEIRFFNELWKSAEKHLVSRCSEQLLGEQGAPLGGARCCALAL